MSFYQDYNDKLAIENWNHRGKTHFKHLRVNPISPALGAEVRGIDLSAALTQELLDEVRHALSDYLVLSFPDQKLDHEAHKAFGRHFGRLHQHVLGANTSITARSDDPEILGWKTGRTTRYTAGDAWHNDVSCDAHPIWVSFLRITRLPEVGGGDTAFCNQYLAYESLSTPFQRFLEGLTAVHDGNEGWSNGYGAQPKAGQTFNATEHPVVARHPVTGRKFLFVNEAFTSHIVQLTREESRNVLNTLYRHIDRHQSFQTRVRWEQDQLLLWDNWAVQHHAIWDYYPFERWGERVSAYRDHGPQAAGEIYRQPE